MKNGLRYLLFYWACLALILGFVFIFEYLSLYMPGAQFGLLFLLWSAVVYYFGNELL